MGNVARSKTTRGEGLVSRYGQTEYQPRSRAAVLGEPPTTARR